MTDSSRAAIGGMTLFTPDGRSVVLDEYAGATLVVQFVRYFGCLPCRVYLRDLDERSGELAALGARAIAVGGSADLPGALAARGGDRDPAAARSGPAAP